MNPNNDWPTALRMAWLNGGLVAVNDFNSRIVSIRASVAGRTFAEFFIPTYGSLFPILKTLGLQVFGATFVTHSDQLEGFRSPEFRMADAQNGWPLSDTSQAWRNVVYVAGKANNMRLMDMSSRIAASLQFSEMRLYDLAAAYSAQLHAHLRNEEPKEAEAFKDTFSPAVYKDIHSLFWEMAVLRDLLAEFVAVFCLNREGITTLSGLRKSLRKEESGDSEANQLLRASDKETSGWLARFGTYRDCFTHSASLHDIEGVSWAIQDIFTSTDGRRLPQIYYPLPPNVEKLSQMRTKGPLFSSLEEMALSAHRKRERSTDPDALEYLYKCLSGFTDLARCLVNRSPLAPRPIVLTEADIIGAVKVNVG